MGNVLGGYFLRRLVGSAAMLFIVMSAVFVADRNIGDPARMILGDTGTEADVLELRIRMGLEDPWHVQYGRFVAGLVTFDLGETFRYGISKPLAHGGIPESRATLPIAAERLPATFLLTGVTIALAVLVALPLGIWSAVRPRTLGDRLVNVLSLAGVSIVEYWFAAHPHPPLRGPARLASDLRLRHRGPRHPSRARPLAPADRADHPDRAELDAGRACQALRHRGPGAGHPALEDRVRPRAQERGHPHRHHHRRRDYQRHHRGHHHRDGVRLAGGSGRSPSTRSRSATCRSSRRRSSSSC